MRLARAKTIGLGGWRTPLAHPVREERTRRVNGHVYERRRLSQRGTGSGFLRQGGSGETSGEKLRLIANQRPYGGYRMQAHGCSRMPQRMSLDVEADEIRAIIQYSNTR